MHVVLLVVVLVVIIPCTAGGDIFTDRIEQIQLDMERTQKELEEGEKKLEELKDQEQRVMEEYRLLEQNIQSVNQNLNTIRSEERTLERRIVEAQADYETSSQELDARADSYAAHLKSMYQRRKHTTMASVLRAGSVSALMRGMVMVRAVARADMQEIDSWREKTASLSESVRTLEQALDAKRKLSDAKQEEQVNLRSSSTKKQQVLDSIRQDEERLEALNEQYRQDMEATQNELYNAIREHEQAQLTVAPSLRNYNFASYKGQLVWPVNGSIYSTFGRQVDPRTRTVTENRGIEIETTSGEPVHVIGRGEVVQTQYMRGYGNCILVSHPPDFFSIYGHLADILVSPGDILSEGQIIGTAGNTGLLDETKTLLVLDILQETTPLDPLQWLTPDERRARN